MDWQLEGEFDAKNDEGTKSANCFFLYLFLQILLFFGLYGDVLYVQAPV